MALCILCSFIVILVDLKICLIFTDVDSLEGQWVINGIRHAYFKRTFQREKSRVDVRSQFLYQCWEVDFLWTSLRFVLVAREAREPCARLAPCTFKVAVATCGLRPGAVLGRPGCCCVRHRRGMGQRPGRGSPRQMAAPRSDSGRFPRPPAVRRSLASV